MKYNFQNNYEIIVIFCFINQLKSLLYMMLYKNFQHSQKFNNYNNFIHKSVYCDK